MATILLADDNPNILTSLTPALKQAGYNVITAGDGAQALRKAKTRQPDLLILDINMPKRSGVDVYRELRSHGHNIPIIFLAAQETIRQLQIDTQLDRRAYLAKPFKTKDLLARVRVWLPLRVQEIDNTLRIDIDQRQVWVRKALMWREVDLTPHEFALLQILIHNTGRSLGKSTLLDYMFDTPDDLEPQIIDRLIGSLRQKVEPDPAAPRYILNVHQAGYRFDDRSD